MTRNMALIALYCSQLNQRSVSVRVDRLRRAYMRAQARARTRAHAHAKHAYAHARARGAGPSRPPRLALHRVSAFGYTMGEGCAPSIPATASAPPGVAVCHSIVHPYCSNGAVIASSSGSKRAILLHYCCTSGVIEQLCSSECMRACVRARLCVRACVRVRAHAHTRTRTHACTHARRAAFEGNPAE